MLVNAVRFVRFGVTTTYPQALRADVQHVALRGTRGLPNLRLTLLIILDIQISKKQ